MEKGQRKKAAELFQGCIDVTPDMAFEVIQVNFE